MHLEADVLARTESSAHTAQDETHLVLGHGEAGGDLFAILVEPLGRDVQLDSVTTAIRHRQCRLETEKGLILHSDLVRALDLDLTDDCLVTRENPLVAEHVPEGMDRGSASVDATFGIGDRLEYLVGDFHRRQSSTAGLRMIGGDRQDRLSEIANDVAHSGEHRLVLHDQAVVRLAGHVVSGHDAFDARDLPGVGDVDVHESSVRVRAAQGRSPQHALGPHVAGEGEASLHLGGTVGTARVGAQGSVSGVESGGQGHAAPPCVRPRATTLTASRMRPYPVQRQMLPDNASLISSSSGCGFRSRR